MNATPRTMTASALQETLAAQPDCQLLDVREPAEFQAMRIVASQNLPLSRLKQHLASVDPQRPVYLLCRSGTRAEMAAKQFLAAGVREVHVVEGGILAWHGSGLPVEQSESRVWSLERQVRFTAGALVLSGVVLSLTVHPWFLGLAGFVGAGLMFAGATDTCAMGMLLARMPWNQGGAMPVAACQAKA